MFDERVRFNLMTMAEKIGSSVRFDQNQTVTGYFESLGQLMLDHMRWVEKTLGLDETDKRADWQDQRDPLGR